MQTDTKQKNKKANTDKDGTQQEGWDSKRLGDESSYDDTTDTKRRILRKGENKGEADERDVAGSTDYSQTDSGKEDRKQRAEKKAR